MKDKRSIQTWVVSGWRNGDDYDNNKAPDKTVEVQALTEGEADEAGDDKITEEFDKCEVIVSTPKVHKNHFC